MHLSEHCPVGIGIALRQQKRCHRGMNTRRALLWLHRWVGITAGLVIFVIAVSGGALVFEHRIQRWLRPDLYPQPSAPASERAPLTTALANLQATHHGARVQGLRLPRDEADALVLFTGQMAVHFDPRDGRLLGTRPRMGGWEQTMIKLHVSLLQGQTGGTIVVVATCITIVLSLSGLWLWWPLRIFTLRRGSNMRRFNLDLHSVAGLYSSIFLLIIAITGLTLRYLHGEHPRPPMAPMPPDGAAFISVDQALVLAEKALPGARAMSAEMPPPNPRAPFRVQLAFPEDGSPAGRSVVFLNQVGGAVLATHSSRVGTLMQRFQMAQLSIHTGSIGGTATQWIALLACIALVLQVISGYVLWLKRA